MPDKNDGAEPLEVAVTSGDTAWKGSVPQSEIKDDLVPETGDPLDRIDRLTSALRQIRVEVAADVKVGTTNRRYIWGLIITIVVDVLLTLFILNGYINLNHLEHQAATNAQVAYTTCISGNQARDAERHSWDLVFNALEHSANTTPSEAAGEVQYQHTIDHTLADRLCVNPATGHTTTGVTHGNKSR